MRLTRYLEAISQNSQSYFQAHLAKEDLAKVEKLACMARERRDIETLRHDALYLGWTPGDLRTGELKEQLLPLIHAMHAHVGNPDDADKDEALLAHWKEFHQARIRVLIHCL